MSGRKDFSDADWQLLASLPSRIGHSVMIASTTRLFGGRREMRAMKDAIADMTGNFIGNQLVKEITPFAESERKKEDGHRSLRKRRASYHEGTVKLCENASSILAGNSDQGETEGFKRWLLFIGEEVANAFLTDEFMGIGGEVISKDEVKVLKNIASALGVKDYSIKGRDI
ncbi:MAG: hypothetical protein GKC03_01445 [Methanomassiliicoccales archaeon]|nr:hypothetical protein [Methanomassiliicoccales archaeon]NYT14389.1 hypothetical protein [Methanomassiliicoccales archaeon]